MMQKKNVLLIDSNMSEATEFVNGLKNGTGKEFDVWLYENLTYGVKRYLKFFLVAIKVLRRKKELNGGLLIAWQQFYGFAIAFFARLFHLKKPFRMAVMTFIYQEKKGWVGKVFKKFVSYAVTSVYVDKIIVNSSYEAQAYRERFGVDKFVFAPWGALDFMPLAKEDEQLKKQKYIFSVGRSNRDYPFLIDALEGTQYNAVIACGDKNLTSTDNVTVRCDLRNETMIRYMYNAHCVVIPLQKDGVSAGQLVLLHALNLGVPVIITRSKGVTDDYVKDGKTAIVISKNKRELLDALQRLEDGEFYKRLSEEGRKEFYAEYTKIRLGENIAEIVKEYL